MQINIKANHIELTPAITGYAEEKLMSLDKFIERFEEEEEAMVNLEIGRTTGHHNKGDVYNVKVNMEVKGEMFRVDEVDEDLYACIDKVKDTLREEIVKFKEKEIAKRGSATETAE